MDPEERRILEQYRGQPVYYRKLEEYRQARARTQPFRDVQSVLSQARAAAAQQAAVSEPPPVTDYYRRYDELQQQRQAELAAQYESRLRRGRRKRRAREPEQKPEPLGTQTTEPEASSVPLFDEEGI